MSKPKILIQLDSDAHASVFDAVVALDAGVDQLLQYHAVEPTEVRELVHGAMFTRGGPDLQNTAIFIGGSTVSIGETLLQQVTDTFFGPLRVSVMLDANGANTTAAAAVLAAAKHIALHNAKALVLAATGPVGQRVVRILAGAGASVHVASRNAERAQAVCASVAEKIDGASLVACSTASAEETANALHGTQIVIAAGAAGIELLNAEMRRSSDLEVAIDLNAVPPPGIAGIEATDKAVMRDGLICYGALAIGGVKMKIHKAAIQKLFQSPDQILDAEQIYQIGIELQS
jgi:hypothetical protein